MDELKTAPKLTISMITRHAVKSLQAVSAWQKAFKAVMDEFDCGTLLNAGGEVITDKQAAIDIARSKGEAASDRVHGPAYVAWMKRIDEDRANRSRKR